MISFYSIPLLLSIKMYIILLLLIFFLENSRHRPPTTSRLSKRIPKTKQPVLHPIHHHQTHREWPTDDPSPPPTKRWPLSARSRPNSSSSMTTRASCATSRPRGGSGPVWRRTERSRLSSSLDFRKLKWRSVARCRFGVSRRMFELESMLLGRGWGALRAGFERRASGWSGRGRRGRRGRSEGRGSVGLFPRPGRRTLRLSLLLLRRLSLLRVVGICRTCRTRQCTTGSRGGSLGRG
ncbi:hypothetical protein BDY17DRAFT_335673, partial [Neohortaea acidophila]